MAAATAGSGMCSCCSHASICSFPRDPGRPIFLCEEFEIAEPKPKAPRKASPAAASSPGTPTSLASAPPISHYRGLCSDCANGPGCTFPKPEGGVWHCEEYC